MCSFTSTKKYAELPLCFGGQKGEKKDIFTKKKRFLPRHKNYVLGNDFKVYILLLRMKP